MNFVQHLRNYWLSARYGLIYVSFVSSFVTVSTVTYYDIGLVHWLFPSLEVYAVVAFVVGALVFAPIVGHFHWRYQNPTDVVRGNIPLLNEIRKIVKEEAKRQEPGDE